MEEIKVGEYVRTIDGYIRKVVQVNKKGSYEGLCYGAYSVDKKYKNSVGISAKKIKLHSLIPIDLIEKGDYVNGERVLVVDDIITDGGEKAILVENYDEWTDDGVITNKDIKSIVTHEQFAEIEYKIEE